MIGTRAEGRGMPSGGMMEPVAMAIVVVVVLLARAAVAGWGSRRMGDFRQKPGDLIRELCRPVDGRQVPPLLSR